MPSSPTPLLGVEQQAAGENLNVWGDPNLNQALQRLTEAVAATTSVSSYPVTLTSTNYVANQARNMILVCTGAGGVVTIPAQSKLYVVSNRSSGNVTLTCGGLTAIVASGDTIPVICDGTDCRISTRTDFQNATIKNLANGVNPLDGVNKQQLDAILAAANAYTDATAFASASLPGQAGQAGKFLTTNGTATSWADVYPAGTLGYTLYFNGSAAVWGSPSTIRGNLGLGGAAVLNVGTTAGTVAAGNDSRIVNAIQNTGGVFVGGISGPSATFTTFNGSLTGNVTGNVTGSISGNAGTATAWATARDLELTGDATATLSGVNGTANVSGVLTLANSGVTAGTYQAVVVDAKGRVTSGSTTNTIYASGTFTGSTGALVAGSGLSVVRNTAGDYTVTISPAAPNANYRVFMSGQSTLNLIYRVTGAAKTTTSFSVLVQNSAGTLELDPTQLYLQVVI